MKVDPNVPYIQVRDKDGQTQMRPNPHYRGPAGAYPGSAPQQGYPGAQQGIPTQQAAPINDSADPMWDKVPPDRSYCPEMKYLCPESSKCVYWYGPAAGEEKEGEEGGGCTLLAQCVSNDRANEAKAEFFEKAQSLG